MKLLLCCESYWPHRGGVQEVMRQIAERLAARGHYVTVATSRHPQRKSVAVNGVTVRSFKAGGNLVYGLSGQIGKYRQFVTTFDADAILIMAAQQWSFDALWPVLDDIKARKVFIPCGFSGLFEPYFAQYFKDLPAVLRKFDRLVFNAEKYRDIDFVRKLGLSNFTVLPNGISEADFEREADGQFRQKLKIPDDAFLFLTVGNPIEAKGHRQVVEAFSRLNTGGQSAVLLSIAGWAGGVLGAAELCPPGKPTNRLVDNIPGLKKLYGRVQPLGRKVVSSRLGGGVRYAGFAARRIWQISQKEGWGGFLRLLRRKLAQPNFGLPLTIETLAVKASAQPSKRVILTDLERQDLVQAYFAADLFVFASHIEYSPLVLFEAAAAGTPFLTVPVGNADEIVRWTGGGILCEAAKDERGYTRVDPETLAKAMSDCMKDRERLNRLGEVGRERWRGYFTWKVVASYYEDILAGRTPDVRLTEIQQAKPEEHAVSSVA
jgi:glycosyltransferase involved in cell wall biosynthesis